ncbi:hypothetical protein [Enterovirga sp. CN4-39]|uniref:hypothetical protein n=1 Tax=Enterovirga sp. CN4-39 TaxID=3400910 RepID=UPI003C01F66C
MKKRVLACAVAALCGLFAQAASAQRGDDKRFGLINETRDDIREFKIFANGRWSNNWLSRPLAAGRRSNMAFRAAGPSTCAGLRTRAVINNGSPYRVDEQVIEQVVNYCGLRNLRVREGRLRPEWD